MRVVLISLVIVLLAGSAFAQTSNGVAAGDPNGGLALTYSTPRKDFDTTHKSGYGAAIIFTYPGTDAIEFTGVIGYSRFQARSDLKDAGLGIDDLSIWEFTAGPRIRIKMLYVGLEGGYFTKVKDWSLVPNVGVRWKRFDVGLRTKTGGDALYWQARAGVFF